MSLTIHQFPCLSDNYGYLIRDDATGVVAAIDTPDADAYAAELDSLGWRLNLILNTHWHADHAGGNETLKAIYGATIVGPAEVAKRWPLDRPVQGGDKVELGATRFMVIDVGGHTLQHIAYHDAADDVAFVGDSLFALGCGRMFEGTPVQMWSGLDRLARLPSQTRVYCAHEYTEANARFALSVDDSPALKARADEVFAARRRGEPTVPTTIGAELATNPFLRAPQLALGRGLSDVDAFAAVRKAKDTFKG